MQKNDAFSGLHPIVNFIYFAFAIVLSACLMHPVCLAISTVSGLLYARKICESERLKSTMRFAIPMTVLAAVINPLYNHAGVTILAYLPGGNALTLESLLYGLAAAVMIFSVIVRFACFSEVMTQDKLLCLLGRMVPALSLVVSMALRFIPRFTAKFREVLQMQEMLSKASEGPAGAENGKAVGFRTKVQTAVKAFSSAVSWALENSVETAGSMRARGYGLEGRTSYTVFRFDAQSRRALVLIVLAGLAVSGAAVCGVFGFTYFPQIKSKADVRIFAAFSLIYALLLLYPLIADRKDERNWKNSL